MRVEFTRRADAQLRKLQTYLSIRFYPERAAAFVERLVLYCESLARTPRIGTQLPGYGEGVRAIGFERRVTIYFKAEPERVVILGIFYRGRTPEL